MYILFTSLHFFYFCWVVFDLFVTFGLAMWLHFLCIIFRNESDYAADFWCGVCCCLSPTLLFLLVFHIWCSVLVMWRSGEYFVLRKARKAILGIKSTMYYELPHCLDAFLIFDVEISWNWSTKFRISEGKSWNFIASQRVQPVTNRRVCVLMFHWSYFPTV